MNLTDQKIWKMLRILLEERGAQVDPEDVHAVTKMDICFPIYKQDGVYEAGDIRRNRETDQPFRCLTGYDADLHPDWDLSVSTLWAPYHGNDADHAYPWAKPTGSHDLYKAGEYMTWTDGVIYKAVMDTVYSPEEYPQAWEIVEKA